MAKSSNHLAYAGSDRYMEYNCRDMYHLITLPMSTQEMIEAVNWGFDTYGFDAFVLYNQPKDWTRDDLMRCLQEMLEWDHETNVCERDFFFRNKDAAATFKLQWC